MPVSIFSETEWARLASFPEEIPGDDLIRAFTLTGAGRDLVAIPAGGRKPLGARASALCASLPRLRSAQFEHLKEDWDWDDSSIPQAAWEGKKDLPARTFVHFQDSKKRWFARHVYFQIKRRANSLVALWSQQPLGQTMKRSLPLLNSLEQNARRPGAPSTSAIPLCRSGGIEQAVFPEQGERPVVV